MFSVATHKAHSDSALFNAVPSQSAEVLNSHAPDMPFGDIKADATHCHACISAYLPIAHDIGRAAVPALKLGVVTPGRLIASNSAPESPPPKA